MSDLHPSLEHFQTADPLLHQLHLKYPPRIIKPQLNHQRYFQDMAENIIGQQLNVRVAEIITNRFRALFPTTDLETQPIAPEQLLNISDEALRTIGLSRAKTSYVKALAEAVVQGSVPFAEFQSYTDEEIIEHLIKVKGIGRWTAEMFLIFTLGRPDVFSFGDLGLKRALEKHYGVSLETPLVEIQRLSEKWAPYRSAASLILWSSLDNQPK